MMALLNTLPYGDSIRNVEYYSTNDFINSVDNRAGDYRCGYLVSAKP